jgi:hypothetical protein
MDASAACADPVVHRELGKLNLYLFSRIQVLAICLSLGRNSAILLPGHVFLLHFSKAKALMIWPTFAFPHSYFFDSKTNQSQIDILYYG